MSTIVTYEGCIDECITVFLDRFYEYATSPDDELMDMGHWFLCYAADTISMISWSKRLGFLDRGDDQEGLLRSMHDSLLFSSLVGIYAWAYKPIAFILIGLSKFGFRTLRGILALLDFVNDAVVRRQLNRQAAVKPPAANSEDSPRDFLNKCLDSEEQDPGFTTAYTLSVLGGNVVAGADTTASSLSGIFYYLLKYPATLERLRNEIDEAWRLGKLSSPTTFHEAQALPYLQAVIQEGLRIHPAVGLTLPRVVPEGGAHISGQYFPQGTEVGVCAWVIHRSDLFGSDAGSFRPERWLEASEETLVLMRRLWMPFGGGSRTCIGKHISLLEMNKLIPEILRRYDLELSPELQDRDWQTKNHWFVVPQNLKLKIRQRIFTNQAHAKIEDRSDSTNASGSGDVTRRVTWRG
ncbi:hypothetical protein LTR74_018201 [Friedmanniomyces endolithicus]|nr:hypothetical protein LTR74_018201 [Friedmanniomyces endolithicus]